MTKTKKQLRADAVERLRNYEGTLPLSIAALETTPLTVDEARYALIDLLTDNDGLPPKSGISAGQADANDGNELQDVTPNAESGVTCNETGGNVTDSREKLEAIIHNAVAEATNGGRARIHGAIPVGEAVKSAMRKVDELLAANQPISRFDARKTPEKPENGAAEYEMRDFDADDIDCQDYPRRQRAVLDSDGNVLSCDAGFVRATEIENGLPQNSLDIREKLEADVKAAIYSELYGNSITDRDCQELYRAVIAWLDRQATITEREQ